MKACETFLAQLERNLRAVSTKALGTLLEHLEVLNASAQRSARASGFPPPRNITVPDVARYVCRAFGLQERTGRIGKGGEGHCKYGELFEYDPAASNEQMMGTLVDVIDAMAKLTGRPALRWHKPIVEQRERRRSSIAGMAALDITRYKLFIGYDAEDPTASSVAATLQMGMQQTLRGPVVREKLGAKGDPLKRDDEDYDLSEDLSELLDQGVGVSSALLLVQTANVLSRPWTLLQVYEALSLGIPVVCVYVEGAGYDFTQAQATLNQLSLALDRALPNGYHACRALLHTRNLSFRAMQRKLQTTIPFLVSVKYLPNATFNRTQSSFTEIARRIDEAKATAPPRRRAMELKPTPSTMMSRFCSCFGYKFTSSTYTGEVLANERKMSNERLWQLMMAHAICAGKLDLDLQTALDEPEKREQLQSAVAVMRMQPGGGMMTSLAKRGDRASMLNRMSQSGAESKPLLDSPGSQMEETPVDGVAEKLDSQAFIQPSQLPAPDATPAGGGVVRARAAPTLGDIQQSV